MAKPGSRRARELANGGRGGVDLSLKGLSDEQAAQLQEVIELKMGRRCGGCKRRIGLGMVFTSLDPREAERPIVKLAACSRADCDFMEKARDGATVMQAIEYVWLDPAGIDARAAEHVKGIVFVDEGAPL